MSEMTATRTGCLAGDATISLVLIGAWSWLVAAPLLWRSTRPGRSPSPEARSARLLQRLRARRDGALRAVPAHRLVLVPRGDDRRAPRPDAARAAPGPEHGSRPDRRGHDRRDDHARRRSGRSSLPFCARRALVGASGTAWRDGPWFDWLLEPWAQLGGEVAFVMLQIAIVMVVRAALSHATGGCP